MTSDQVSALITIGISVLAALGTYIVLRIHFAGEIAKAKTEAKIEVEKAKGAADAKSVELDEAKRAADLKNLQLVQQQVDDQKAQLARLQARETARDTTDKILTSLVENIGEVKISYATGMQAWAVQTQALSDRIAQAHETTDHGVILQLGLAVSQVNQNTKTLFDQLIDEIRAMGNRLETAINQRVDPEKIATALSEDVQRLESKLDTLRNEQSEIIRQAVADALNKGKENP